MTNAKEGRIAVQKLLKDANAWVKNNKLNPDDPINLGQYFGYKAIQYASALRADQRHALNELKEFYEGYMRVTTDGKELAEKLTQMDEDLQKCEEVSYGLFLCLGGSARMLYDVGNVEGKNENFGTAYVKYKKGVDTLVAKLRGERKVLIAEDTPVIVQVYERILHKINPKAKAEVVTSGKDLVQRAGEEEYWDVILTDNTLEEMTGLEAITAIRKFDRETPIYMISGDTEIALARDAVIAAGATQVLTKPFGFHDVAKVLERYVKNE